jgi:hypothetical protein
MLIILLRGGINETKKKCSISNLDRNLVNAHAQRPSLEGNNAEKKEAVK